MPWLSITCLSAPGKSKSQFDLHRDWIRYCRFHYKRIWFECVRFDRDSIWKPSRFDECIAMPGWTEWHRAGSGVVRVRTAPLRFLAGCRKSRLNQALSVLSQPRFFWVCIVLLTRATFYVVLFMCSVAWLFLLGCQYQCKWLTGKTRLRNDL